jgi:hypothetical protein
MKIGRGGRTQLSHSRTLLTGNRRQQLDPHPIKTAGRSGHRIHDTPSRSINAAFPTIIESPPHFAPKSVTRVCVWRLASRR